MMELLVKLDKHQMELFLTATKALQDQIVPLQKRVEQLEKAMNDNAV